MQGGGLVFRRLQERGDLPRCFQGFFREDRFRFFVFGDSLDTNSLAKKQKKERSTGE